MNAGSWGAVIVLIMAAAIVWGLALSPGAAVIMLKVLGLTVSSTIMGVGIGLVLKGIFLVRYVVVNVGLGGAIGGILGGTFIGVMELL